MRIGFAVNREGVAHLLELSDSLSEGFDILVADGMPSQKAADMVTAAERSGKDPAAFAQHVVKLRLCLRRDQL